MNSTWSERKIILINKIKSNLCYFFHHSISRWNPFGNKFPHWLNLMLEWAWNKKVWIENFFTNIFHGAILVILSYKYFMKSFLKLRLIWRWMTTSRLKSEIFPFDDDFWYFRGLIMEEKRFFIFRVLFSMGVLRENFGDDLKILSKKIKKIYSLKSSSLKFIQVIYFLKRKSHVKM